MAEFQGCPGSRTMNFDTQPDNDSGQEAGKISSQLRQWPIQMHLISPTAPYYQNADVLLTADCVAYALGDFHREYMKDKSLAIACPKLQVPCCMGLLGLAREAAEKAKRKIPIKSVVVGVQGEVIQQEWV